MPVTHPLYVPQTSDPQYRAVLEAMAPVVTLCHWAALCKDAFGEGSKELARAKKKLRAKIAAADLFIDDYLRCLAWEAEGGRVLEAS